MKHLPLAALLFVMPCMSAAADKAPSQACADHEKKFAALYDQYQESVNRAKAEQEKQIAEYKKQMAQQQAMLEHSEKILAKQDALMARMAADQDRWEKVLATWERRGIL